MRDGHCADTARFERSRPEERNERDGGDDREQGRDHERPVRADRRGHVAHEDRSRHLSKGHFTVKLSAEADRFLDFSILPQGAMFAITRWTNFFYTNDPVGGPLGHLFLRGIDDQPLKPIGLRSPLRAHISYWDKSRTAAAPCIATLRDILQRPLSKH